MRDGRLQEVRSSDIVVGDFVILSEGVRVPADARLVMHVEAFALPSGGFVKPEDLDKDLKREISLCLPRYSRDPTDLAISIAVNGESRENAEPDILVRQPRTIANFLNWSISLRILRNGLLLAVGILGVYLWLFYSTQDIVLAQTAAFVTWLLGHIMLALNLKQEKLPLLKQGIFSNRFGAFWLAGMIPFSLIITTVAFIRPYLHTSSLPLNVWLMILAIVFSSTWWIEASKIKEMFHSNRSRKKRRT